MQILHADVICWFDEDAFCGSPVVEISRRLVAAHFFLAVDGPAVRVTGHMQVTAKERQLFSRLGRYNHNKKGSR